MPDDDHTARPNDHRSGVTILRKRCLVYRHRSSSCRACTDICPANAISVQKGYPEVSDSNCSGCGACVSACQTEALIEGIAKPSHAELCKHVADLATKTGMLVVSCARAGRINKDGISVGCLARLDVSMYLLALAKGAKSVRVYQGPCAICHAGSLPNYVASVSDALMRVVKSLNLPVEVTVTKSGPKSAPEQDTSVQESRRRFLKLFRTGAQGVSEQLRAGAFAHDQSVGCHPDSLSQSSDAFVPERRVRLLEALRTLVEGEAGAIACRSLLTVPVVDRAECYSCTVCSDVCPTGALRVESVDKFRLTCAPLDCIGCNLCVETCHSNAISLGPYDGSLAPSRTLLVEMEIQKDLLAEPEIKLSRLLGIGIVRN